MTTTVSDPPSTLTRLTIRLETDERGAPIVTERDGQRSYAVVMEVENPPRDTFAATFELDDSYYDPVRVLTPDPSGRIRLKTFTRGDFPVFVRLSRREGANTVLKESVSRALRRDATNRAVLDPSVTAAINRALDDIATH